MIAKPPFATSLEICHRISCFANPTYHYSLLPLSTSLTVHDRSTSDILWYASESDAQHTGITHRRQTRSGDKVPDGREVAYRYRYRYMRYLSDPAPSVRRGCRGTPTGGKSPRWTHRAPKGCIWPLWREATRPVVTVGHSQTWEWSRDHTHMQRPKPFSPRPPE